MKVTYIAFALFLLTSCGEKRSQDVDPPRYRRENADWIVFGAVALVTWPVAVPIAKALGWGDAETVEPFQVPEASVKYATDHLKDVKVGMKRDEFMGVLGLEPFDDQVSISGTGPMDNQKITIFLNHTTAIILYCDRLHGWSITHPPVTAP